MTCMQILMQKMKIEEARSISTLFWGHLLYNQSELGK